MLKILIRYLWAILFQSKRDHTRDYFSAGKPNPNPVHGFGDDALPMHGLYHWHLPDPISFKENLRVTFQTLGNDDIKLYERQDDISSLLPIGTKRNHMSLSKNY